MVPPPGVYFNSSPEECVPDYLRSWIHRSVFRTDVYRQSPGALAETFPCGRAWKKESSWYFLTRGTPRKHMVTIGGSCKVEQKAKDLLLDGQDKWRLFG
jgi:hypothetical protein